MTDKDTRPEDDKDKNAKKSTDPQEHMKGPISSLVQNIKESGEENDADTKEEADRKKDANT